jgi:hypothetical protein
MHIRCRIHREIAEARYTTPNKRTYKIIASIQLREILYTDSEDMLILPFTVAWRYYKCWTDGSISSGNCGYPIIGRSHVSNWTCKSLCTQT